MDKEAAEKIAALENRIAKLENFINQELIKIKTEQENSYQGFSYYVDKHQDEHNYISKLIYSSYGKTHPEAVADWVTFDKILGKTKDDGTDPQP